jgi:sRNA-binding protein
MHEGIAQLAELYPNCFRQPGQPLKIGIRNDVVARHPELQPGLIASALRTYTRSVGYLKTLKAGAVRIDLEGNPVGTVTAADEADAERRSPRRPGVPRSRRSRTARGNPPRLRIYHPAWLQPRPSR